MGWDPKCPVAGPVKTNVTVENGVPVLPLTHTFNEDPDSTGPPLAVIATGPLIMNRRVLTGLFNGQVLVS
jgi:hypothetical protein